MNIDFNENEQLSILNKMVELYPSVPSWPRLEDQGDFLLRHRLGISVLARQMRLGYIVCLYNKTK
ncbi:hypothetical protein D3C76_173720 [compost metagenome]